MTIVPVPVTCDRACGAAESFTLPFTMAFQPIIDVAAERVWGYEALVRGAGGEPAGFVLGHVDETNRYRFDQACRVKAIELAGKLFPRGGETRLSINFMPNAVYEPSACIRQTLAAARRASFPLDRLMFEFTEDERFGDVAHVKRIVDEYRRQGFLTAIDDFGAGYSGLQLLAAFRPDLIKLDMQLIRGLHREPLRRAVVSGVIGIARSVGVEVLAEGVETEGELAALRSEGVTLFQGYYFAQPTVERLPPVAVGVSAPG